MYRKFRANRIFTGEVFLGADTVLISTGTGEIVDIIQQQDAGENIEIFDGILAPGFINCHCHLELSHLKGVIPKNTGLVDFVLQIVAGRHFANDLIIAGIEKAEKEMLRNGIVAVGDICNTAFTIGQKTRKNIWYRNFIETAGFPPAAARQRFQSSVDIYNAYAELLPANSIVPHAAYSVSPALLQLINDFEGNEVLTIHNQETAAENDLFENGQGDFLRMFDQMHIDRSFFKPTGKSSLQSYLPFLDKFRTLILVHNVFTSKEDIVFANARANEGTNGLYYCLCPNANMYITGELPDVPSFIAAGCELVLGTDSLASNDELSILEEIKTLKKNFPDITLETLLKWATINGAKALDCDRLYGSFEKGKTPGIILIENANEESIAQATVKRIL